MDLVEDLPARAQESSPLAAVAQLLAQLADLANTQRERQQQEASRADLLEHDEPALSLNTGSGGAVGPIAGPVYTTPGPDQAGDALGRSAAAAAAAGQAGGVADVATATADDPGTPTVDEHQVAGDVAGSARSHEQTASAGAADALGEARTALAQASLAFHPRSGTSWGPAPTQTSTTPAARPVPSRSR